jgi:Carboxypeptidase regulatory-like domain
MKRQRKLMVVAIFALVVTVNLKAQSLNRGQIRGAVTDAQGAVVPGVDVLVTNTETNVVTKLKTNESGFYVATELVPGTYTVQFRAQGFEKLDISNVVVKSGTTITEDGVMRLGQLTETVNVSSAPPVIETTASNFTTSISTQIIDKVPIVGRDIQTLLN